MHPVALGHARFKMACDVLDVTLTSRVQRRAEATSPVLTLAQKLDHLLGMWARLATVALLVVLVERVRTPEAAVAARFRAWVFSPTLVELVFVALPIVFPLKAGLARCAPVNVLLGGGGGSGGNGGTVDERGAGRWCVWRRHRERGLSTWARRG